MEFEVVVQGSAAAVAALAALPRRESLWVPLQQLFDLVEAPPVVLQQQGPLQQQLQRLLLLLLLAATPNSPLLQQQEGRKALAQLWGRCRGLQLLFFRVNPKP